MFRLCAPTRGQGQILPRFSMFQVPGLSSFAKYSLPASTGARRNGASLAALQIFQEEVR